MQVNQSFFPSQKIIVFFLFNKISKLYSLNLQYCEILDYIFN